MASFTLFVTQSPFDSLAHQQALDFARAALQAGHRIQRVFFYTDAVLCASACQIPIQGQTSIADQWGELAMPHQIPLQACIANALRRGLADTTESDRYNLTPTLHPAFSLVGLGDMAEAVRDSDRIIEF